MGIFKPMFLVSLLALVAAKPTGHSNMLIHASKSAVPTGFTKTGTAPANQVIPLRIALVQNNIVGLEKVLYDVSTPGNSDYRKHLSKEEVLYFIPDIWLKLHVNNVCRLKHISSPLKPLLTL